MRSIPLSRSLLFCVLASTWVAPAAEPRPFREARFEKGELKYVEGLPVLIVEGTPQQIGRQKAALTGDIVKSIANYPQRLLTLLGRKDEWPKYVRQARGLVAQFPAEYREEMAAFALRSGVDRDMGLVANTIMDLYRGSFACSSIIVEPQKSATGHPLFGRNLDFFTLNVLDKNGLVTVCRPEGKHAFVTVGFPGLLGCLSGMNDAGLAVAVHEVYRANDNAPMFNPKGVPYTMCFRRILEECSTVEDAEKLLRSTPRTTMLNLAVCDRRGGAVLEMTPETVAIRRASEGLTLCTNHFRTPALGKWTWCGRYTTLSKAASLETLGLPEVAKKLDEVHQGFLTVQTMVFEPDPLVLHVAMGSCPATKLPLKRLPLEKLLVPGK